jgi:hypothetical protein
VADGRQRVCGVVSAAATTLAALVVFALGTAAAAERTLHKARITIVREGPGLVTNESGSITCGSRCSARIRENTVVTLTAQSVNGSTFVRWSGACTGDAPRCALYLNAKASTTAVFSPAHVDLDVVVGGAGRVTSHPPGISCGMGDDHCRKTALKDATVQLEAEPASTSAFAGWTGACSGPSPSPRLATTTDGTPTPAKTGRCNEGRTRPELRC